MLKSVQHAGGFVSLAPAQVAGPGLRRSAFAVGEQLAGLADKAFLLPLLPTLSAPSFVFRVQVGKLYVNLGS